MAGLDVYESTFEECRPGSRLRARVKMRVVRTNVECNKHSLQWRHTATSAAVQFSYIEQLSQKGQNISNLRNSSAVFANTIIVAKRGSCACGPESSCASQDATSFFNLMVGKSANLKSKALREFCEDVNKTSLQVSAFQVIAQALQPGRALRGPRMAVCASLSSCTCSDISSMRCRAAALSHAESAWLH